MLREFCEALDKRHERKSMERLVVAFAKQMLAYDYAETSVKIGAATSARGVRHAFAARYPDTSAFINAPYAVKSAYLSNLTKYVQGLSEGERVGIHPEGVTNGAVLVQFWITALAWGDYEVADAMAEQLERLNRLAYEFACTTGRSDDPNASRQTDEILQGRQRA